jgi:DNA polymerase-3 subunit gamma/tau
MAYLALYRKYRPKFLKDVIGQCSIVKTLQNSIKLQKISHAYIFAGPKGTGKTSISKIFAKAINCENYKNGDACGECNNCKIINEGKTQDILEIDAASNNGIDDVKNLIEKVHYLPMNLNKKIYIIDEAHMLTNQSWNALLKIIEEPPAHVVFIFATTEIYKIPSTISSRCQQFFFNKLIDNDLTILLQEVSKKENINISIDGVKKIITIADGAARDALSILDQLSLATNNNITIADIEESFGLVDDEKKIFLIKLIIEKDIASVMCELDNFSEKGINFYNLCNELIFILLDKLIFLQTNDETLLKRVNKNLLNKFETNVDQTIELINI